MSSVQNDQKYIDGENYGAKILANKQFNSERKHTIRKHALGEIKNVIHNQATITPFKGLQPGPSKLFSTNRKQSTQLENHHKFEQSQKVQSIATNKPKELEKRNVSAPRTCNENCCKSLDEIWSEMNVLDPDILERLVNGDGDGDDAENDYDIPDRNFTPINFEDDFELAFELQNPCELEDKKLLENLLAQDYECAEFPLAVDWMDDL